MPKHCKRMATVSPSSAQEVDLKSKTDALIQSAILATNRTIINNSSAPAVRRFESLLAAAMWRNGDSMRLETRANSEATCKEAMEQVTALKAKSVTQESERARISLELDVCNQRAVTT